MAEKANIYRAEYLGSGTFRIAKPKRNKAKLKETRAKRRDRKARRN